MLRYLLLGSAALTLLAGVEGFYIKHLWSVVAEKKAETRKALDALKLADTAIHDRDLKLQANADHEAKDASELANLWKGQTRAAFDAGYASHRCPGEPTGLRAPDLRSLWSAGAFKAAPDLPGKP